MFKYAKKFLFSLLLVLMLPYMNSISKAMDRENIYSLNVKSKSLQDLRDIHEEEFHKPHIILTNISSKQKFFDNSYDSKADCYHYQKSISQKLLKAIAGGYVTKLEYSFSPQMKADKDKIEMLMYCIAKGQKIAKVKESDGTSTLVLKMDYGESLGSLCSYRDFIKISNRIVVMCGNEPHFITREWQEMEETNNRLAQRAAAEAQDERRRNREDKLETMGGGAYGYSQGYDPYFH